MDMTQGMIPLNTSPDIKLMQSIDKWSQSESAWKREGQTRLVSLVAGAPLAMVGAAYNAIVLLIKLPVTTFRVLTGWIPTKNGHFRDDLPTDTSLAHLMWHGYKIAMCTIDIILVPTMGLIHPKANNWIHIKLCVSFAVKEAPKEIPKHKQLQPPPPPPPPINRIKIKERQDARGEIEVDGKKVKLHDFEANAIAKMRSKLRPIDDDSDNEGYQLPLGDDDLQEPIHKKWGMDLDPNELVKQRKKLRDHKTRQVNTKKPSPQDLRRQEEDRFKREQQSAIDKFREKAISHQSSDSDEDDSSVDSWDDWD